MQRIVVLGVIALLPLLDSPRVATPVLASTATASISCTLGAYAYPIPSYSDASFTIATSQTIAWTASYDPGYEEDNGSCHPTRWFVISQTSASGSEIKLTMSGQTSGTKALAPGTYHVGIRSGWMGPGRYTITYNRTSKLVVTPSSHDFGLLTTGLTSTEKTFTIASVGDVPATVSSVTSVDGAHFPVTYAGGGSMSFKARYVAGSTASPFSSRITVAGSNAEGSTVESGFADVYGETRLPRPNIMCSGPADLGTADHVLSQTLIGKPSYTNNGDGTLVVSNVIVENDNEAVFLPETVPSTTPVQPSERREVLVKFTPSAAGGERVYGGRLRIFTNDADEPVKQCPFTARAHHPLPKLIASPAQVDHGRVPTGMAHTRAITIRNTGDANLQVAITDAWTGNPQYESHRPQWSTVPLGATQTVLPGQSTQFFLRYAPQVVGAHQIAVGLQSNDATAPATPIEVQGTGFTAAPISVALVYDRVTAAALPESRQLGYRAAALLLAALRNGQESFGAVSTRNATVLAPMTRLNPTVRSQNRNALKDAPTSNALRRLPLAISRAAALLSGAPGQKTMVFVTSGALSSVDASAVVTAARQAVQATPGLRTYVVVYGDRLPAAISAMLTNSGAVNGIATFTTSTENGPLTSFYYGMYP